MLHRTYAYCSAKVIDEFVSYIIMQLLSFRVGRYHCRSVISKIVCIKDVFKYIWKCVSTCQTYLDLFAKEKFRAWKRFYVPIVHKTLKKVVCNLRKSPQFQRPEVESVYHGKENISNFGLKIWGMIPPGITCLTRITCFYC